MPGRALNLLLPDGSQSQLRGDASGNVLISGSSITPTYTYATLPVSGTAGQIVFVSNAGTKGSHWYRDGTIWKPLNGICHLASLDATSAPVANAETIKFQYLLPANIVRTGWRLRLIWSAIKSGTTDTMTGRIRMGTAGTTSDTLILNTNHMTATHRGGGAITDFRLESATSITQLAAAGVATFLYGYSAVSTAAGSATTITSAAANALWFSVGILSTSTNDTVSMVDAQLYLVAPAN